MTNIEYANTMILIALNMIVIVLLHDIEGS